MTLAKVREGDPPPDHWSRADLLLIHMRKEAKREVCVRDLHSTWINNKPHGERFRNQKATKRG